jgi:radical SAM protein (TIGR01212 family)
MIMEPRSKPYRDFSGYLRGKFGTRVQKIPVDTGFTCPNRDGTLGVGGCLYCAEDGTASPVIDRKLSIKEQVRAGIAQIERKYSDPRFIVYFQPHTNTYAPIETLRECYREGLGADERIVGLAIGTRPDCLGDEVLKLLDEFLDLAPGRVWKEVWVEIGLQSMHEKTLKLLNRCHDLAVFERAVIRTAGNGFKVCVHVILGLPGESKTDMIETAQYLSSLPVDGVKIHSLYVLEGTGLADMFHRGELHLLTMAEYIQVTCDFLEHLRPDIIIQRLTGDPPPQGILGPGWCQDKRNVLAGIYTEFASRGTRQGFRYERIKQPPLSITS